MLHLQRGSPKNDYKRSLEKNGSEASLQQFLLFLLAIALSPTTPAKNAADLSTELQRKWDGILSVALEICNEDQAFNFPVGAQTPSSDDANSERTTSEPKVYRNELHALVHS